MSSVQIVAILTPKADKVERLEGLLMDIVKFTEDQEPDVTRYQLQKELETDSPRFIVIETYKNSAALEAHMAAAPFQRAMKAIEEEDLFAAPSNIITTGIVGGFNSRG